MNRIILITALTVFLLPCVSMPGRAQEIDVLAGGNEIRLPIVPKDDNSGYLTLDDEIAHRMVRVMREVGLYDILVGILYDSGQAENDSIETEVRIVDSGRMRGFSEMVLITETDMYQEGIPPENEDLISSMRSLFKKERDDEADVKYPNNILTALTVRACFFDIESGDNLGPFELYATYIGGSKEKSKAKALKALDRKIKRELKRIYWFSADIDSTDDGTVILPVGTDQGIAKGMVFEVVEPDRVWTEEDREYFTSGGVVAWASVTDTTVESSRLKILRQWGNFYEESWVVKPAKPIWALQVLSVAPSTESYTGIGLRIQFGPAYRFDFGLGINIGQVTDSFNDNNFAFGLSGFGLWRFLNHSTFDLGANLGLDLDIPFRKDDDGRTVNTALFSTQLGIIGEIVLSKRSDLFLNVGYRFALKTSKWEYSEDDTTFPAYWENGVPEVDISGIILAVGYKYYLF